MASQVIGVDTAELIGSFIESILCGVLFIAGIAALYVLRKQSQTMPPIMNILLSFATVTMLALGIAHLSVDAHRISVAFFKRTTSADRIKYLSDFSNDSYIVQNTIFVTEMLVGDMVLIYRVYAVWGNLFVALVPSLLSLGSVIAGYGSVYELRHASPGTSLAAVGIRPWVHAFIVLSLVANATVALLIAARLISQFRKASLHRSNSHLLFPLTAVIIESGSLNAITFLAYEICFALETTALRVIRKFVVSITGLTFVLVIFRVYGASQFIASSNRKGISQPEWGLTVTSSAPNFMRSRGNYSRRDSFDMQPLEVHLERSVERRDDDDYHYTRRAL